MEAIRDEALDSLISQLDAQIKAIAHLDAPDAKLLLSMARLDLLTKRHEIDDDELRALCATLERALISRERDRRQTPRAPSWRRHRRPSIASLAGADTAEGLPSGKSRRP